jgi:uncharacterized membrane protein
MASDSEIEGTTAPQTAGRTESLHVRLHSPDRVVALSDGVFAIILTILVLELKVPSDLGRASLRDALVDLRPTLLAWVVSFLISGMYWIAHRDLFAAVRFVNRELVWLNLLFLLPASLIPFAASVVGQYPEAPLAIHFYCIVMITVSVARLALYSYAVRHPGLLWTGEVSDKYKVGYLIVASPIFVYGVAMALASVSPLLSMAVLFSVPILYFALVTVLRHRSATAAEADDFS